MLHKTCLLKKYPMHISVNRVTGTFPSGLFPAVFSSLGLFPAGFFPVKKTQCGRQFWNAVEREPVETRVLNPTASEAS